MKFSSKIEKPEIWSRKFTALDWLSDDIFACGSTMKNEPYSNVVMGQFTGNEWKILPRIRHNVGVQ